MDYFAESLTSEVGFLSSPFLSGPEGDFETNTARAYMGDPVDKR